MSAYLISSGAVGFLAAALFWVAREVNTAFRSREQQLHLHRREADAAWARTLELLEIEGAERRIARSPSARGGLRRLK
jgi:hypothetical protein